MTTREVALIISMNAAQALGLLSILGIIVGINRLPRAKRPDFMYAFIVFLFGILVAQIPVHVHGVQGSWSPELILVSAIGRSVMTIASILFVRSCLVDVWPWYGWVSVVAATLFVTFII